MTDEADGGVKEETTAQRFSALQAEGFQTGFGEAFKRL